MSALKGTQKAFKASINNLVSSLGYPADCVSIKFFNSPFSLIIEVTHFQGFTLRNAICNFIAENYGYLEIDQHWNYGASVSVSYK